MQFLRLIDVLNLLKISRSTLYHWISDGLFVPPVKLGKLSVWPEHELLELQNAQVRGDSKEQVQALVTSLLRARKG